MKTLVLPLLATPAGLLRSRALLHLEIPALRQQLAMITNRERRRVRFRLRERLFWLWLCRIWPGCFKTLAIFKPDTLVRWHQQGFKIYWRYRSRRGKLGRPKTEAELQDLIRRLSRENPLWGATGVQSELTLLGYQVAQSTVAKYMRRRGHP